MLLEVGFLCGLAVVKIFSKNLLLTCASVGTKEQDESAQARSDEASSTHRCSACVLFISAAVYADLPQPELRACHELVGKINV